MSQAWENSWRDVMHQTSRQVLQALVAELATDRSTILQGATVSPPPLATYRHWETSHCCPVAYCLSGGLGGTVHDAESQFAAYLERHPELQAFLDWWDYAERETAVAQLRREILQELDRR